MFIPENEFVMRAHFLFRLPTKLRSAKISEISGKKENAPADDADVLR